MRNSGRAGGGRVGSIGRTWCEGGGGLTMRKRRCKDLLRYDLGGVEFFVLEVVTGWGVGGGEGGGDAHFEEDV